MTDETQQPSEAKCELNLNNPVVLIVQVNKEITKTKNIRPTPKVFVKEDQLLCVSALTISCKSCTA
jgi:hypothetical protein